MNTPQQSLPELEVQLISRRVARRQAALEVLRSGPFKPRWAWALAWVAICASIIGLVYLAAADIGLTERGLIWLSYLIVAIALQAAHIYALNRRVRALTELILDESKFSPSGASVSDSRFPQGAGERSV